jgi:hypothetical protein
VAYNVPIDQKQEMQVVWVDKGGNACVDANGNPIVVDGAVFVAGDGTLADVQADFIVPRQALGDVIVSASIAGDARTIAPFDLTLVAGAPVGGQVQPKGAPVPQ